MSDAQPHNPLAALSTEDLIAELQLRSSASLIVLQDYELASVEPDVILRAHGGVTRTVGLHTRAALLLAMLYRGARP